MGLFDMIFNKAASAMAARVTGQSFRMLNGYTPVFTSRAGSAYETELVRSAIHAKAKHSAKLKPEVVGNARVNSLLAGRLDSRPNPFQTTSQFLYRTRTILENDTTAFIIPLTDPTDTQVRGFYPLLPSRSEIVEFEGQPWMRYTFANGQTAAIEFWRVGILTKHQYMDDFFGSGSSALDPTLDLIDIQRQGMTEAVKQSAMIRFMGRLAAQMRPEDIKKERDRFSLDNLSSENTSGILLADSKYADIKQIESKPFVADAEQMKLIKENVYSYFGVNDAVLQNSYDENGWDSFYEGEVEPFAVDLGLVLTNMVYTEQERREGNRIMFSSNRLQYASNTTKVSVATQLGDRGWLSNYGACDIFNLPYPKDENGNLLPERWVIRGEYIDVTNLPDHTVDDAKAALVAGQTKTTEE